MAKPYKRKSNEEKEKEVNELIERANVGIENCFTTPEQVKELASYMSRFYNYSLRNTFLIQEQFRGALAVGSYAFWKEKGFAVNKGEKGIKILVPNKLSDYFINEKGEEVKLKDANPEEKKLIEQGEIEVRQGKLIFNQGYVFEVTQTNAKAEDLPKIFPNRWLDGEIKNYDLMYKAMENIAKKIGVTIIEPKDELGAVKGASYPATKEVALNPRNTQLQNVKTLIHELTHAKLHTMETRDNYTTNAKEFQAEMAAYVVCSYFGLDTSEYSFRYISSWTKDVELKDKEKLINEVRETVKEYIEVIEKTLVNDKDLSLSLEKENLLEKKIEDEKLINFLGKDRVVIKEITRDELENIINENNSNVYLQKDKELNIKNEVVAIEVKGKYTDVYIGKSYDLNNLIYIDDDKNLYKVKEEKIHDKNLYEIKEQEVMNNNIKDIFKNLKEKVMIKVNSILRKEIEEIDIEKELREFEELFDSMEMEEINESMYFMIDGISLEASMENGIEEEKLLKLKDDLIELYEREISKEDKNFMEKRGLGVDEFIESFEDILKKIDFEEGDYYISFKEYLEEELKGYADKEYEEFEEETYMDRLERQQIGEEEYIKIYGKNNPIDSYMPYYVRAYISYENIDKAKIYPINESMKINNIDVSVAENFKVVDYKGGNFIIEFPNLNIKESITFDKLQKISTEFKYDIENILDATEYFYEKEVVNEVEEERENDNWKLTDKEIAEADRLVELEAMKENIEKLMKENYGDFVKAMISIEKGIDNLDLLDKVYEEYMESDYSLLNNEINKTINFEQENIVNTELENYGERTVEVIYSEVPSFVEGEKLTLVETLEKFKKEAENGTVDKAIEFTFSLNENIKYNEEFIIDKGTSVDLIEFINEKIGDNFHLHELVDDYLKSNDLEFEHKEIILDKDKKIEKYKDMELE